MIMEGGKKDVKNEIEGDREVRGVPDAFAASAVTQDLVRGGEINLCSSSTTFGRGLLARGDGPGTGERYMTSESILEGVGDAFRGSSDLLMRGQSLKM